MTADLLTDETLGVLLRWTPAGPRKRIEAHIAALRADRDAARELAEGWRLSGLQETTMRIRAEVDRDTLLDELEVWVGVVDLAPEALEVLKRVRPPAGRLDNAPASRPRGVGGGDRA